MKSKDELKKAVDAVVRMQEAMKKLKADIEKKKKA